MKIKSAKSFRYWYKTEIREIDKLDLTYNENFVGTYHKENGKKSIKGFFEMYHGDKPDIASYLPSILKIAEDGQAIYEFLQNAVDCGSTHFYIFYDEKYFLAINNGKPFDIEGLRSILNIAQTTKKDPNKIGRFGIGFKLAHRLVGKNEGTEELTEQYKGPILFSWSKLEDLESLIQGEQIEPIEPPQKGGVDNGFLDAPYLLKLLLTNFPSDPNELVKDIKFEDKVLFSQEELDELIIFLNQNFQKHSESLKKDVLAQGSLFFIKLGDDKKKLLDKDYAELKNGIEYSMNTLNNLEKVYLNNENISKTPLSLEEGVIKTGSEEFERISPEYKEFDIKFSIGFNAMKFGNEESYQQIHLLKQKPNFYKYFPMGDEVNGLAFIIHCDSFSNEANRRKLQKDHINSNLFPELAKFIIDRLNNYKKTDKSNFLNLYASILLSDIPNKENNEWLKPVFYDILHKYIGTNIPTKTSFLENPNKVKINKLKQKFNLSTFGIEDIEWFEWDNANDNLLITEATSKLGIEHWDIRDIVENANLEKINSWIANCDNKAYNKFLEELENSNIRIKTKEHIKKIKFFKFSNHKFYSLNDLINKDDLGQVSFCFSNVFLNNNKTEGIKNELIRLGLIISELKVEDYPNIFSSIRFPEERKLYYLIAKRCFQYPNTLTPNEKKNIFINLTNEHTKFDKIKDSLLKSLLLFCDSSSKITPLNELIGDISIPRYLSPYKIKKEEFFPELNPYLLTKKESIFQVIYQRNKDKIITELTTVEEIKSLIKIYQNLQKHFFEEFIIKRENELFVIAKKTNDTFQVYTSEKNIIKFINDNCVNKLFILPFEFAELYKEKGIIKGDNLQNLILTLVAIQDHKEELVDIVKSNAKQKFLAGLTHFKFDSKQKYLIEDYEYKILELVINEVKDFKDFQNKVSIIVEEKELTLSEIPPIIDSIKIEDYDINLAKVLPNNYGNSEHLSALVNQFIDLGLNKDRIEKLFGISAKPEAKEIFEVFSEQVKVIENAEQLAFLFLYALHIEKINFEKFKALNINGEEIDLVKDKYLDKLEFIQPSEVLHEKYNSAANFIKKDSIIVQINKENNSTLMLIKEPYFDESKFICPHIKKDLDKLQKVSFVQFLFNKWNDTIIKGLIKKNNWNIITDIETKSILSFNPATSVYPSQYACKSEVLPEYLLQWIDNDENKIAFLSDLGVWTESSIVVKLRKFLSSKCNEFMINQLLQEVRLNNNENILFNTFNWLKEKSLTLTNIEQLKTFEKVVEIINNIRNCKNQTNPDSIETSKNTVFTDDVNNNKRADKDDTNSTTSSNEHVIKDNLDKNETIDKDLSSVNDATHKKTLSKQLLIRNDFNFDNLQLNSTEADKIQDYTIYLYDGKMPVDITLDEVQDYIFYQYNQHNYAIQENKIYINTNEDKKKTLQKIASDDKNNFTFEDLWMLFNEKSTNEQKLSKNNSATLSATITSDISKNDQKEVNREAKELVRKRLEHEGFSFTKGINKYSIIDGVLKDGQEFPLVVKSYIFKEEPLKIGANEWIQLMKPNSMLWVNFGNGKLGCLKLSELLKNQDKIAISFSTENLDVDNRLAKLAELLRYFGNVHFDFNNVISDNVSSNLGNYSFDERKTEEDLSSDDESLL
ncbi:sacsin N-terminal ATP-binding-like domain-containing protein [Myroides sp. LJL115]